MPVLDADATGCVAAIDLGGTTCVGTLSDLQLRLLAGHSVHVAEVGDPVKALVEVWDALSAAAGCAGRRVGALTVGIPAVLDPDTGLAVRGPNVGWESLDIAARFRGLDIPVYIDNDVRLAAVGEGRCGEATGVMDYAVLSVGTGLGGAIVAGGQLIRGRHHAAGELGALVPRPEMVARGTTSGPGALESVLSGSAIARSARLLTQQDPSALAELGPAPTAREVIAAGLAGRPHGRGMLDEIVVALAQAVIAFAALVDPELVILDGSVGRALEPVLPDVSALTARHIPTPPRLAVSRLQPNATVLGGAAIARDRLRQAGTPLKPSHALAAEAAP